jgi:hypothetical protein
MANTKDTLLIVPASGNLDETKNAAGRTVTAAEITAYGLSGETGASALATAGGYVFDEYVAAVQGTVTVDTTGITAGEEFFVTLIDVTDGRRQFPRKTFRGATAVELKDAIDGAELEVGDGKAYGAAESSGIVTITFPANVIAKVAANEDAAVADGTAVELNKGLTNAQAVALVGDKTTKAGRTNRVGFPIIEPGVFTDLGVSTTADYDVLTKQIVSAVKFDKNVGASYQDVENVTIIIIDGATLADTAP